MGSLIASVFTENWLPVLSGAVALAAVLVAALRGRGEDASRLYGDAMSMVVDLRGQLAEERAKRENLELRLVESNAERHDLEQQIFRMYRRIEDLEARVGGRRDEDPAS